MPTPEEIHETASQLAECAHRCQKDKAGRPYFRHLLRVAYNVAKWDLNDPARTVALLHDIIEDTCVRAEDLRRAGIPDDIIRSVETLTHPEEEPYMDFIRRVKPDPIARRVKIADLIDNLDLRRLDRCITLRDAARVRKYAEALAYLVEA